MPDRLLIHKLKFCLIVCLSLGYALTIYGQKDQPFFKYVTVEDGLSNNWIKSILKDKDGFMWFGTFNGLNRYDGSNFKIFQAGDGSHLTDNIIECLAEDNQGHIWVGTFSGGLNRYDRNAEVFTSFQKDPNNPASISSNKINALFHDSAGQLWIGTDAGLDRFDHVHQRFEHFLHNPADPNSITPGFVSCIFQDHNGRLWIGTEGGLNVYMPDQKKFLRYNHHASDPKTLAQDYVKSIYEDKYGNIWLGTWGGGLDKFLAASGTFEHYHHGQNTSFGQSNNAVLSLAGDHENLIYIATEGGGLTIFDIQQGTSTQYLPDVINDRSINSNSVHTLYYDDLNGVLWAGTYNGGINYFSKWDKPFMLYQARVHGLNNNHVTAISEDKSGRLWIGTDGGGINIVDEKSGKYSYLNKKTGQKDGLQNDAILSILCDSDDQVWIGTYNGGLDVMHSEGGPITHFTNIPADTTSLGGKNVNTIYEDKRGNIWVGTMFGGLNLYNRSTKTFTRFTHDPANATSIIDNFIYGILEDRLGRLLVQTGKGLEVYDYKTGIFERFNTALTAGIGVPITLLEDSQGNLWVGSQENGLFRIDRTGVKVNSYTIHDGLPSNSISGILEDQFGNLWISTQRGLCKFEGGVTTPEKIRFHIYSIEDGLQGSEFKRGAFYKLRNGQMVFGGQNGFNVFDPVQIKHNPFVPPVKITGFKIFNKDVDIKGGQIAGVAVSETNAISLRHHQTVFTFEFSALNYLLPEKNNYAYMMEGFEETWNYVGTQRSATYSNLDPGEYYFVVKASNNDGIWNETGTRIKVTIVPPWWDNFYFKMGLVILLIGAVFLYYRMKTYQLKRSKRELEERVALSTADLKEATTIIELRQKEILTQNEVLVNKNNELKNQSVEIKSMAEEIRELTEAKIKFYANISHELQPPLQAILQQAKDLLSPELIDTDPHAEKHSSIYSNANRLSNLLNQLLDWEKHNDQTGTKKEPEVTSGSIPVAEDIEDLKDPRQQAPYILVVEPDKELAQLIYTRLKSSYQLEVAMTGADGYKAATEQVPDLILCESQLSDMDGLALVNQLKRDERTSHIPVILITTRNISDNQTSDISAIADDHIVKPFQPDLLELKIKNIFFTREKLKNLFLQGTLTMPDNFNLSAVDKQFLKKAMTAVKDNMKNAAFGVDEFSGYFGMSRRNVLRKMKGVTGLSINEYIRSTRLKEAYNILGKGELNVSEVAYAVGFTDPKYFSTCFKKQFGKLPSEVRIVANT